MAKLDKVTISISEKVPIPGMQYASRGCGVEMTFSDVLTSKISDLGQLVRLEFEHVKGRLYGEVQKREAPVFEPSSLFGTYCQELEACRSELALDAWVKDVKSDSHLIEPEKMMLRAKYASKWGALKAQAGERR